MTRRPPKHRQEQHSAGKLDSAPDDAPSGRNRNAKGKLLSPGKLTRRDTDREGPAASLADAGPDVGTTGEGDPLPGDGAPASRRARGKRGRRNSGTKSESTRRRRRLPWRWLAASLIFLLLLAVVFVPSLMSVRSIRQLALNLALPQLGGQLSIDRLDCSWWSSIELRGIRIADAAGQPLLEVPSAKVARSLWQLVRNPQTLGLIEVDQPVVSLELHESGSNLEELLNSLLAPGDPRISGGSPTRSLPTMRLRITNATVVAHDTTTDETWRIERLTLDLDSPFDLTHAAPGTFPAVSLSGEAARTGALDGVQAPPETPDLLRPAEVTQTPRVHPASLGVSDALLVVRVSGFVAGQSPESSFLLEACCTEFPAGGNTAQSTAGETHAKPATKAEPSTDSSISAAAGRSGGANSSYDHTGTASLHCAELPLGMARYIAGRLASEWELSGCVTATANLGWSWHDNQLQGNVRGEVIGQRCRISCPDWFGSDSFRSESLRMDADLRITPASLEIGNLKLGSDIGGGSISGRVPLAWLRSPATAGQELLRPAHWDRRLGELPWQSEGEIDLAALASMMPETLHIKDQVQLRRGNVVWKLTNSFSPHDGTTVTQGSLRSSALEVEARGQPLRVDFPIALQFVVEHPPPASPAVAGTPFAALDGNAEADPQLTAPAVAPAPKSDRTWRVRTLDLSAPAARLTAKGDAASGQLRIDGDLERLLAELGQVVALGDLQASGRFQAQVDWTRPESKAIRLAGRAELLDFELIDNVSRPWREDRLSWECDATLATLTDGTSAAAIRDAAMGSPLPDSRSTANPVPEAERPAVSNLPIVGKTLVLQQAEMRLSSGADRLALKLVPATPRATSDGSQGEAVRAWPPFDAEVAGRFETWQVRIARFVKMPCDDLRGEFLAEGRVVLQPSTKGRPGAWATYDPGQVDVEIESLQATARQLAFRRASWQIQEPMVRLQTAGRWSAADQVWRSARTTLSTSSFSLAGSELQVCLSPRLTAAGVIGYRGDIARLQRWFDTSQPADYQLAGQFVGTLRMTHQEGLSRFETAADLQDVQVYSAAHPVADVRRGAGSATIWSEPKISCRIQGAYDRAESRIVLDDLRLESATLAVTAHGTVADAVSSSPSSSSSPRGDLQGEVAFDLNGLSFGPGKIEAQLAQGVIRTTPWQFAVGNGQFRLSPRLYLNQSPWMLTAEPGPVLENIELTPELCAKWLKYVAPLLADATAAEGKLSLTLAAANIPLNHPETGQAQGTLLIHQAQVGAGPLARRFLEIAQQIKNVARRQAPSGNIANLDKPWMVLPEQQISFQLANGRVYHRGLIVQVDDVVIRTQGWVSVLDERLEMMAEVPIQDRWIAGIPALAGMRGQSLQLPIGGTLSRPAVDSRAISQLSGQLIQRAAEGFLKQELNNQLEKQLQRFLK